MMMNKRFLFLLLAVIAVLLVAGCTQQQQAATVPQTTPAAAQPAAQPVVAGQAADTMKVVSTPLGNILADGQGKTLYYFARDRPQGGTSACAGQCASTWPPFSAGTIQVTSPLDKADFDVITRADGTKQTTYYGWPLYYYQADMKQGDISGNGVIGSWFVIKPDESVLVSWTPALGSYLTDASGKTLYVFTKDGVNSTCTGACIAKWPAFGPDYPLKTPSLLDLGNFGPVTRDDGIVQSAYMGRPLYYYSGDGLPGDVTGQGFNGVWYVANVSGLIPSGAATVTAVPATTRPASTGYGGY
jgi:predicted lipoprotein with Yx(FWY)xxD motif